MAKDIKLIVFIGPDGCGKTTIAKLVGNCIDKPQIHKAANFEVLPTFGQIRHYVKSMLKSNSDSFVRNDDAFKGKHSGMQQKPNSILKSWLLVTWYTLDYVLGFVLLFKAKRTKTVFLFARYFFDFYFQISNKNIPSFLLRFYEIFIPSPDFVFYLHQPAIDIYERKPELVIEEIERQQNIILSLASKRTYFKVIDASNGIEATVKSIMGNLNG